MCELWVNALVRNQLILSQAVLKHVVSSTNLCKGPVLYPAKNEEIRIVLFHIKKFFMLCYILASYFKQKISTCGSQVGHMWVTSGLFCGLVGQMGQQV